MRRALGLRTSSQTQAIPPPATPSASTSHPQRRRFVRDGEVPVSVIHRDQGDPSGTNALEAARQALREQVAAREHAEHLLQDAQATIHDLQTKLAHEGLARDEALQRVDNEKQVLEQALQRVREELAAEQDFRRSADQERDRAIVAR
jgi:phosphoenolpyruvate-protein kinase (PTS system EI component)